MEAYQLCWQVVPGGRVECESPQTQETAEFRRRDKSSIFPTVRFWIDSVSDDDQAAAKAAE